jgi:hypothetical protein
MDVLNPPALEHAPKNKRGRPRGAMTRVKRELREWLRKKPEELAKNIRDSALNHPDGFVRLGFSKLWAEYAYGKPLPADGENPNGPQIVQVITGVRSDISATPPSRPLLPDGRDPFAEHAAKPRPGSSRPVGRAPVAEPPCPARLTEGPLKEGN